VQELDRTFQRIADRVAGAGLRAASRAGAETILEQAKANIRDTFVNQSGRLENSGRIELEGARSRQVANILFDVIYAAVHEYGLQDQPITDRQRAFFWAMWAEEGDEMWKALALSETYTIPARPYLRPAIDSKQREALREMARVLAEEIKREARGGRTAATIRGGGRLNY